MLIFFKKFIVFYVPESNELCYNDSNYFSAAEAAKRRCRKVESIYFDRQSSQNRIIPII